MTEETQMTSLDKKYSSKMSDVRWDTSYFQQSQPTYSLHLILYSYKMQL